jgi:hypothetical protein
MQRMDVAKWPDFMTFVDLRLCPNFAGVENSSRPHNIKCETCASIFDLKGKYVIETRQDNLGFNNCLQKQLVHFII